MTKLIRKSHQGQSAEAGLHVLFRSVFTLTREDLLELAFQDFERLFDRQDMSLDPQVIGQRFRIIQAALGRILARHGNSRDVFATQSLRRDDGGYRRVDPAAETEYRCLKSAFQKIIANTQHQRPINLFFGRLRDKSISRRIRVSDRNLFLKCSQTCDRLPVRINDERTTVENQLIIPTDGVAIKEGDFELSRQFADHLDTERSLTYMEG